MPNFTYSGNLVSGSFAQDIFNAAWDRANSRAATAALSYYNTSISAYPVRVDPSLTGALATTLSNPGSGFPPTAPAGPNIGALRDAAEAQLQALLQSFISNHFPAYTIPDTASIWERIVLSFDGTQIDAVIAATQARVASIWTARGVTIPQPVLDGQSRYLDRPIADVRSIATRVQDMIRKERRKEIDLQRFERTLVAHVKALEAARVFLVEAVQGTRNAVTRDQLELLRFKRELQSSYWRYIEALSESDAVALERAIVQRRLQVDQALSAEERKAFIHDEFLEAITGETESVASQAIAAIGQIQAQTSATGSESV